MDITDASAAASGAPTAACDHVVQFYEDDDFLFDVVGDFVSSGLAAGEPAVIIATPEHREGFVRRLRERGTDVDAARAEGRLVLLDARETLESFMAGGMPDARAFARQIGPVLERAAAVRASGATKVRAYGEMVDLLWKDENPHAAIRLEELWNDLGRRHPFALLCAYTMANFYRSGDGTGYDRVCKAHTHVLPSEASRRTETLEKEVRRREALEVELRQALNDRRRAHEEIEDFFENAPVPMHWVARDGTIVRVNRAELELLGYEREEVVGRPIGDFHADAGALADILRRLAKGETLTDYEARLRRRDGSIRHVLITSNARFDDGAFNHTRCFTKDVTDEKRVEAERAALAAEIARRERAARKQTEDTFQLLVESVKDYAIFVLDPHGHVLTWNAGAERLKGYRADEIVGKHFSVFYPAEKVEEGFPDEELRVAARVGRFEDEGVRLRKDGSTFVANVVITALHDPDGALRGFAKVTRDVTDRFTKAEKALRSSEIQYRTLFESTLDAIMVIDDEGRYVDVNESMCRVFMLPRERLIGAKFADVLAPETLEQAREIFARLGATGSYEGEFPIRASNGTLVELEWKSRANFLPGLHLCIARDITARKRAEQTLRARNEINETLLRVGEAFASELDQTKLVQTVTDEATKLTGAEFGAFFHNVTDESGESYTLYTISGVPRERFSKFPLPRNTAIFDPIFRGEGTMRLDDVKADPRHAKNAPYHGMPEGHLPVRSYLAAPVKTRSGEVLGGLFFGHSQVGRFREDHERLIEGLAAQASVALDNARLYADLRRSEDRLLVALEASGLGTYDYDLVADKLHWDDKCRALFGLAPDARVDFETFIAGVHPDDRERVRAEVGRTIDPANGGHQVMEYRTAGLDGVERILLARGRLLCDEQGRPLRLIGAVLDVTEQRRSQAALGESEARFRLLHEIGTRLVQQAALPELLETIVDGAMTIGRSAKGNLQLYDEGSRSLKIAAQRGFERPFLDFFAEVGLDEASACGAALRSGERMIVADVASSELYTEASRAAMLAADARAVQSTPIVARSGKLLGVFSTHWDRRHRPDEGTLLSLDLLAREAADLIEQRQIAESLREADRRKDEFLAMLAHELRNPLAPITTALHLVRTRVGPRDDLARPLGVMARQTHHMTKLVDDLLEVSRITRGKIRLDREVLDACLVVNRAVEISRPHIDSKRHDLLVSMPHEPLWVDGDLTRLSQVLGNLLNNAAKYTDERGKISVSVEREGREAVFRVRDNGIGIPRHLMPRLFELFTQADTSLDRSQGGLGIGLTLVRGLVELHGGAVEARSDGAGRGAEFIVRLPVVEKPARAEPSREEAGEEPVVSRRIVIVDDNFDAAESLSEFLTDSKHVVKVAHDGPSALELVRAHRPDIVFLDIGLPRLDGFQVARELRREHGPRPILIALTGYGQEDDRRRTKDAGFDHHLVKPVSLEVLADLIRSLEVRP